MVAVLLVLMVLSLPLAARGEAELQLVADIGTEYDSNVFQESDDPKDDYSVRASAQASLVGKEPRVSYGLRYQPTYVRFFGRKNDENVDHVGSGELDVALGPRTALRVTENVQSIRNLGRERIQVDTGGVSDIFVDDEVSGQRTFRNRLGATLTRGFGTRWVGSLSASHGYFDPLEDDRIGSQTMGASLGTSYGWDAWNRFGASAGSTLQLFEGDSRQPPSSTSVYQVTGDWFHAFDANTTLSLGAGPALLVTRQDRFGVVSSRTSSRWTVFANGRLNRRWSDFWDSSLSYDRSQSDSSGQGQSTIRDAVSIRTTWEPLEHWALGIRGDWTQRNSTTNEGASPSLDGQRWTVSARGSYRLTRRTRLSARVRYNVQDRQSGGSVDELLAFVGVRYTAGPWRLWN